MVGEFVLRHRNVDPAVLDALEAAVKAALPRHAHLHVVHGLMVVDALLGIAHPVRAYELVSGDRRQPVDLRVLAKALHVKVPEALRR